MNDKKIKINFNNILRYTIFLLAFFLCGVLFNVVKIEAANYVSIPDKGIERDALGAVKSFTVYVGSDSLSVNKISVSFSNGQSWSQSGNIVETKKSQLSSSKVVVSIHNKNARAETTDYPAIVSSSSLCSSKGITCTEVIVAYKFQYLSSFKLNDDFKIDVKAQNTTWIVGWSASTSKSVVYDNRAPKINYVILTKGGYASGGVLKSGDKITFGIDLDEFSNVSEGVEVEFTLNGATKKAVCNSGKTIAYLECDYTVKSGDGGNGASSRSIEVTKINNADKIKD